MTTDRLLVNNVDDREFMTILFEAMYIDCRACGKPFDAKLTHIINECQLAYQTVGKACVCHYSTIIPPSGNLHRIGNFGLTDS